MKTVSAFPETVEYKSCTATIYRHKHRDAERFEVRYYDLDGSLQRVTFATHAGATTFANTVVEELAKNRAQFVTLRGGAAYDYQSALETLKPLGLSISQAANAILENQRLLAGRGTEAEAIHYFVENRPQHSPTITVQEVVDQMLAIKQREGDVGQLYLRDLRVRLEKFADSFACPISQVSPQAIRDYLLNLKVANRTRHNLRTTLVTLFNFARTEGYLPADHQGVPRPTKRSRLKLAIRIFTPEELTSLLEKAEDDQTVALCIQAFAGTRLYDVGGQPPRGLRRSDASPGRPVPRPVPPRPASARIQLRRSGHHDSAACRQDKPQDEDEDEDDLFVAGRGVAMNKCNTPGSAKAWFREYVSIPRKMVDEEGVWRLCARARTAVGINEQVHVMLQLLGLGQLTDPGLNQATDDAFALLNGQNFAPLRMPVLNAGRPEEIVNWCRYILTQPMERAIELSRPLQPVMGSLTHEGAIAVGQVLRWAMLGEQPAPR